jgi:hypothetical protein
MSMYEQYLAPGVWTDMSAAMAVVGAQAVVTTDKTDVTIGLKATAPTAGILLIAGDSVSVNIKVNDTLKLWARSVSGGKITFDNAGARRVIWDGVGTT